MSLKQRSSRDFFCYDHKVDILKNHQHRLLAQRCLVHALRQATQTV
jgi:hypothetical protein